MTKFKKTIAYSIAVSIALLSSNVPALATVGLNESESNDSASTATVIPSNFDLTQEIGGSIEKSGDVDYYKFVPSKTAGYSISTLGNTDTFGYLYDSNMNVLDVSDDQLNPAGKNLELRSVLTAGSTYYIKVTNKNATDTGNYTLNITQVTNTSAETPIVTPSTTDLEKGNDFSSAEQLNTENYVSRSGLGINYSGDADFFKFTAHKDGKYTFKSTGTTDMYGEVYDSNKNLIKSDDNSGIDNNFMINVSLTAEQTYYIKVTGSNGSTGVYGLDISKGSCLDVPQYLQLPYDELCWATASSMASSYFNHDTIDHTLDIAIKRAKTDYAGTSFEKTYGANYYMYPSVFNQPARLDDCNFSYINKDVASKLDISVEADRNPDPRQSTSHGYSNDTLIKSIDNGYPIIALVQNAKGGGHCILVKGYKEDNANGIRVIYNDPMDAQEHVTSVGDRYECPSGYISFFPHDVDLEPNNTRYEAISLGEQGEGTIGKPGDVDFYKFQTNTNKTCVLEATSNDGTSLTLSLYDSEGNLIPTKGHGSSYNDSRIELHLTPYQTYYVSVSATNNSTGSYKINYTYTHP